MLCALLLGITPGSGAAQTAGALEDAPVKSSAPDTDGDDVTVCGLTVPAPATLPPAESPPIVYALVPCFERQGGQSTVDPATYLYYIHTRPSLPSQALWVPFDAAARGQLLLDFKDLWATGFLEDLSIETVDYVFANGVVGKVIKFDMEERERIRIVEYEGGRHVDRSAIDEKIRDEKLPLRADAFADAAAIRRAAAIIRELLAEKGFLDSTVTHHITPIGSDQKLIQITFTIDEGPKYTVREIDFVGNAAYSDRRLARQMKDVKQRSLLSFITGRGTYRQEKFEEDAERVVGFYRDRGYLRVRVEPPEITVLTDAADRTRREIRLRIPISEGRRYRVGTIAVADNAVVKSEALVPLFKLKAGDFYAEKRVRKGLETARDLYGAIGHFEFTGYPEYGFSDATDPPPGGPIAPSQSSPAAVAEAGRPPVVNVTVRMQEGAQYFVNRISFAGNLITKDSVIRREMRLFEGGVFNTQALKYSVQRIDQLGYFRPLQQERGGTGEDPVAIEKVPDTTNKVNVTLRLQEQNRNEVTFGAGLSGIDGTFVNGTFATTNFLGQGETVRLSGLIGARANNYQLAVTEPYLFGRPISAGSVLYSRKIDYFTSATLVGYSEVRTGASVTAGVPVGRFSRGYATYAYEVIDTAWLDDLEPTNDTTSTGVTFSPFLDEGRHIESRAGLSAVLNTVDNPFQPRRGTRLTANADVAGGPLGGTVSYVQPEAEAVLYLPHTRRTAIGLRAQGGWIRPFGVTEALPYYRRFFLGGETQIRGVDIRTVGPVDAENRALGGTKFVLFNAEYYLDLVGSFRAVLFHDAGQAFAEDTRINLRQLRTSTGAELRFLMPVMNVPFRLIYAWNIYRDVFQPARALKFAVGTTF
jgi:outer membrane protein insertion porin family